MSNPARPLALVTGGSSGIGLELARQFAQHGYDVAISGQSGRVFDSRRHPPRARRGGLPYQGDAATYDGVEGSGVRDRPGPAGRRGGAQRGHRTGRCVRRQRP